MATDIKQALKILAPTGSFKKSEVDELVESLKGITVNELTNDKDKEMFLEVATLSKKLTAKLKEHESKVTEKHKEPVDKLKKAYEDAKQKYDEALAPFKAARKELSRIDGEARDAVSRYATKQMQAAQKASAPKPGEKKFMDKGADASDLAVSKGGHDLGFTTKRVVKILDLSKVPSEYVNFHANEDAWAAEIDNLGVKFADIKVQADGTIAIKIKPADMPEKLLKRVGVKETVILGIGGCPGVTIEEEARAVVK